MSPASFALLLLPLRGATIITGGSPGTSEVLHRTMGLVSAAVAAGPSRESRGPAASASAAGLQWRCWGRAVGGWLWITLVSFLATLPVEQLRAFPSSLSDCQTPTGWNCSGESATMSLSRLCAHWSGLNTPN